MNPRSILYVPFKNLNYILINVKLVLGRLWTRLFKKEKLTICTKGISKLRNYVQSYEQNIKNIAQFFHP